jgi:uncharacterized OB-fold protein
LRVGKLRKLTGEGEPRVEAPVEEETAERQVGARVERDWRSRYERRQKGRERAGADAEPGRDGGIRSWS